MSHRTLILLLLLCSLAFAAGEKPSIAISPIVIDDTIHIRINRIDLGLMNDGSTGLDGDSHYPAGSIFTFLFDGGLAFSGVVDTSLRASWITKSMQIQEWQPGIWGMDPDDPLARFYKVAISDSAGSPAYVNWQDAVSLGADFIDRDGDGLYDPNVDSPPLMGDITIWNVINDGVPLGNRHIGTDPMELEIRQTVWAFQDDQELGDIVFFLYQITNTSGNDIDSLYFSIWSDPDIGDYQDDLIACDTLRQMGYCYNYFDDGIYGGNPPAFGIQILQGAVIDSPGDTALVFKGISQGIDTLLGKTTLPMTSFIATLSGSPYLGRPNNAQEAHNLQMGLDKTGTPLYPPDWGTGGTPSDNPHFLFSGDPVSGSGWRDDTPADKRFLLNSGPFQLPAGETQYIAIAYLVGRGMDYLHSIDVLRDRSDFLRDFFPVGRYLRIVANDTVISLDSVFVFDVFHRILVGADSLAAADWELISRPPGSNATLIPGPGFQVFLDPDIPGNYTVGLQATFGSGAQLSDTLGVSAVNNHPPNAVLTLNPSEITFGSTFQANASASSDPDGDPLHFQWRTPVWVQADLQDTPIIPMTPLHTGNQMITVFVQDEYFTREASQPFFVTPLMSAFDQEDYHDLLRDATQMEFVNGKIFALIPMQSLVIFDPDVSPPDFTINNVAAVHFTTDGDILIAYDYHNSSIDIYTINGDSLIFMSSIPVDLISLYQRYAEVGIRYPYLYLPVQMLPRIEVYDISDLSNPVLLTTHPLTPLTPDVVFEGNIVAYQSRLPSVGLVTLDISDPFNIIHLDSLPLNPPGFYNIEMSDSVIYILDGIPEGNSITIVDATQPNNLQQVGSITVTSIIPDEFNDPILDMNAFGDTLLVGLKFGVEIYDVSIPAAPEKIAFRYSGLPILGMTWNTPEFFIAEQGNANFGAGYYKLRYDSTLVLGIDDKPISRTPDRFRLFQNYPNPFNPSTIINYQLPIDNWVTLKVYDILGREVKTLVNEHKATGSYTVQWDGTNSLGQPVASGVYLYRLKAGNFSQVRKMVLLR